LSYYKLGASQRVAGD
nr:Chain C, Membrane protein [Severe acute respiratory syndrome coronavirus 2]8CME_F Chain F, Membrane protein [Severe acute respiratory syndrome coronavirus 2]8CME_I Chain I, Membrane protein [Severe acute respiratory syndrome coronavirus 2]